MAPETLCRVRAIAAAEALGDLCSVEARSALVAALPLLRRAVAGCDGDGRVMAAANRSLWPVIAPALGTGGLGEAWQACTTLREHRGDGHVAALVTHGRQRPRGAPARRRAPRRSRPRCCGTTGAGARRSGTPRTATLAAPGPAARRRARHRQPVARCTAQVEELTDRLAEPAYAGLSDGALEELYGALAACAGRRGRLGPACRSPTRWGCPACGDPLGGRGAADIRVDGWNRIPGAMRTTIESYKQRAGRLCLDGIEFDDFKERPLSPEALRSLRYMHDVEHHTVCYLRDLLLTPAHRDPDITSFLACWVFEEMWHGEAIGRVLEAHGEEAGAPRIATLRRKRRRKEAISTFSTIGRPPSRATPSPPCT